MTQEALQRAKELEAQMELLAPPLAHAVCLNPTSVLPLRTLAKGEYSVFWKMRQSRPCHGCRLYKNFSELHPKEMEILK